ncbi:hypothetical protein ACGFYP_01600 [Streptomyces sp. NPDC048370]|uniref:hypothetical protein n=1 Tax=Streptomyces sp. NPDC048370 TaxID=3365540 RepID=UPI00371A4599
MSRSERGTAPLEECVLGNTEGHTTHRLAAHYGQYAEGARHDYVERSGDPDFWQNGSYWAIAACPGNGEPALFTLIPYSDEAKRPEADRAYALSVLKVFAERAAAGRRCATPTATTAP